MNIDISLKRQTDYYIISYAKHFIYAIDGKVAMNTSTFLSFVMLQDIVSTILPTDTHQLPALGMLYGGYILLLLLYSTNLSNDALLMLETGKPKISHKDSMEGKSYKLNEIK